MNYLSAENLCKSYGEKKLFQNISFGIDYGQKIALVARNGTGKTTLLKILTGTDVADSGRAVFRKGISVGYLDQNSEFDLESTVEKIVFNADNPTLKIVREYEKAIETGADNLQELMIKMDELQAWDYDNKVQQILSRLNITNLTQQIKNLSGGQRKRVALCRLLIESPDLLIMDEPTNHLDVEMIEWLENYLDNQNITVLMVTHDRFFLDNVCDEILEIENHQMYRHKGNYAYFVEKKAEREYNENSETQKARNLMRKELEWIRKMPKARGTKSKSRVDAFYELKDKAAGKQKIQEMQLNVKMNRIGGKIVELKKLYKNFGDLEILKGYDYTFKTGERIGVVGKNGVGKSTFLNIIQGLEQPDSGKVNVGETVVFGYYSQQGIVLNENKRVIEVVKDIADVIPLADGSKVSASQFLQLFQFAPDAQYNYVSKLSGGEKRRLYLLTVLMKNPNFLILDEPTNDLDLITLNTLEDFLLNFSGVLMVVSHDRYFMNKLVDHLFVFEGDAVIRDFNGSYAEYREDEMEKEAEASNQKVIAKAEAVKNNSEKKKFGFKEKREYEELEKDIADLENERDKLNEQLNKPDQTHVELQECAEKIAFIARQLDEKTMRWLELSEIAM